MATDVYVRVTPLGETDKRESLRDDVGDKVIELTRDVAAVIRDAIGSVAVGLKPDLKAIGASKATVKLAVKLTVKNGKLTALVTEVAGEATVEVAIEFAA